MEKVIAEGTKVEDYQKRPEIFLDLLPVWELFFILHSGRGAGMTPNPISIADIKALFEIKDISGQRADDYMRLILALDKEILKEE